MSGGDLITHLLVSAAFGAEPELDAADEPPVVVVVSGGISRGSYLAGQLYVMQEALRSAPEPPPLVLAGASAGTVSAAVMAIELHTHGRTPIAPEKSALFRTWVSLGLHSGPGSLDAYPSRQEGPSESWLFNESGIEAIVVGLEHYGADVVSPYPENIRVGAQTTRVEPLSDVVGTRINEPFAVEFVPDVDEPFVLHRANPLGGAPVRGRPFALSELGALTRASGAFPLAFAPQTIPCDSAAWRLKDTTYDPGIDCSRESGAALMDGGMFDNNPMALGKELADNQPSIRYIFPDPDLDADLQGAPWRAPPPEVDRSEPLDRRFALLEQEIATFAQSARAQALAAFVRDNSAEGILPVPQRTRPISSDLGGFLGFYDRSFRVWDFYAGMVDAYAFLEAHAEEVGVTPEHVTEMRRAHRRGSPFGMIDEVFQAATDADDLVSVESLVAGRFEDVTSVQEGLDAAIDLQSMEWFGDGYAIEHWRPGATNADLPALRQEMLENFRDLTLLALCRVSERNFHLTCTEAEDLAAGGDSGLRFLMSGGRRFESPDLAAAGGWTAGRSSSDWMVWKIRYRNAWMARHGLNQLVPNHRFGFPTRQWARSALFGSTGVVSAYIGPLDGVGLLYRNQLRVVPAVGLEAAIRSEVSVVTGNLWSGGDLGLMFPAIEPRTLGPLTSVHASAGMSALTPMTGEESFDGVRFVPYASIGLAQVVWVRLGYTGRLITTGDITVTTAPFLSPGIELRAPVPLARRPQRNESVGR